MKRIIFIIIFSCAYTEKFSVSKLRNFCPHVHPCMEYASMADQCDNESCQNAQHEALHEIMRATKRKLIIVTKERIDFTVNTAN